MRGLREGWRELLGEEGLRDLKEGAFSLALCNFGDYISGFFLQVFTPLIRSAPELIALLPAASDARGDVYSSFGSRLGTLLHLGVFKRFLRIELLTISLLILAVNSWVGFLTGSMAIGIGIGGRISTMMFISITSALLSALFMIPATTMLAELSFSRGYDPDNIVAPISTLFGDMITVPTIIAAYLVSRGMPKAVQNWIIYSAIIAVVLIASYILLKSSKGESRWARGFKILRENLPVIIFSTTLSMLAGFILLVNINKIIESVGILAVIPAFLEDGGAIASRFSSRLSTTLHLGILTPEPIPKSRWVAVQLIINVIHGLMIFSALGIFGYAIASWRGAEYLGAQIFTAVVIAGLILTLSVSLITYYAAITAFKMGIDPDNVLAPFLTSLSDIIGTTSLALTISALIHP